jgi:hypothetical protein
MKHSIQFFVQYFALNIIMDDDDTCQGVLTLNIKDADIIEEETRHLILKQRLFLIKSPSSVFILVYLPYLSQAVEGLV